MLNQPVICSFSLLHWSMDLQQVSRGQRSRVFISRFNKLIKLTVTPLELKPAYTTIPNHCCLWNSAKTTHMEGQLEGQGNGKGVGIGTGMR